ncbi:MAG: protein translocase subunit SecF [Actinomycetaceae bacterium]|nr:protein translocase subunit SecF [Actinomycetaceae bacterium]
MSIYSVGNDLYTGEKSFDFVGKRKIWFTIAAVAIALSLASLIVRGLNLGVEFTGGSQFTVSNTSNTSEAPAQEVMKEYLGEGAARVSTLGDSSVRVQITKETADDAKCGDAGDAKCGDQQLSNAQSEEIRVKLAEAYGVTAEDVTSTYIGPSWGQDISKKALRGFIVFVVLAALGLTLYFRTWRNAAGAIMALFNDLVVTVGIYSIFNFEVTPASVIGLLTILAYSLYDTVVVFDKVRENTEKLLKQEDYTFAESTNLAVNQTLIRTLNTSVTSLLPVGSILFIGVWLMGAATLRDLALVMFVGLILSSLSSMFIAAPLAVALTETDPEIKEHTAKVLAKRQERKAERQARIDAGENPEDIDDVPAKAIMAAPGQHLGNRAQRNRKKRKKK